MDFLYRFRKFLSGPPAFVVMVVIVTTPITKVIEILTPKDETEINLSEPPPPPPPPPPKIEQLEVQKIEPVAPAPPSDIITKESVVTEVRPVAPEPPRQIETPRVEVSKPVQAAPRVDVNAIQFNYERIIRGYLESIKRYPTSREARSQRPTGTVTLWLEVGRDGSLRNAEISKSSDSIILDNAALASVRQGKFPAFPAEAYADELSRRFSVSLEYNLEAQN